MNKFRSVIATAVLALGVAQAAPAAVVTNGSFETGDFTGWIATDLATPFFPLSVQTAGSANTFGWPWSSSPTDGNFTAFSGFDGAGPGTISVDQDIGVVTAGSAKLTFDYRAAWDLATFCNGCSLRLFDVIIEAAGGGPALATFNFVTALPETIVLDTGQLSGSVDLTAFIGTDIRVSFEMNIPDNFTGPAQLQFDNVALFPSAVPEPGTLALLGLGLAGLAFRMRKTA